MIYGSWDIECNRQIFLSFWTIFCPFTPHNQKNQNFEKMKSPPGDIIILHMCTINDNHMVYGSWDMECDGQICCHFKQFFALLPPWNPKKGKILKKWKKMPGDTIILHKCTENQDHMLCCSWYMACDRGNCYFSFWAIFCPFTPITAWKMKITKKKKWKKHLEMSSFYTSAPRITTIWYTAPEIWHVMNVIIFHFGLFFALLTP